MRNLLPIAFLLIFSFCQQKVTPPKPVYPIPHERQIVWQEMGYYGFIHFNMNTFSDREWGFGDESPEQFNPTDLDARQWARIAKKAGMKGLIITAKHHDGFCLWPSTYTEHSVKNSPWREGKGDLIQEFVDACREYGLEVGIYYSPWDRNHPDYGKPEYITYMRNQLTELLSNYGDIFEVWFDGANGGDGWYGGANETRKVDKLTYYDWENTHDLVRKLQPNAVLFSDAGPDIRWVGNEHGFAYETTWSNLYRDSVYAGMPEYSEKWAAGQENGTHWIPAESDVSIRPGWYYHAYEDHKVKTLPELMEIYYKSIGRNSSLLINFPVDRRGLIHENDEEAILRFAEKIREDFKRNLALGASVTGSAERGDGFEASLAADGDYSTYWTVPDGQIQATLELEFSDATTFNRLLIQEFMPLGQRVKSFVLEKEVNGVWQIIADGTTVGYKRILRFEDQTAEKIRVRFTDGKDIPVISEVKIYHAPKLLEAPKIQREKSGMVTLISPDQGLEILYSVDGSEPNTTYNQPFLVENASTLKVRSYDPTTEESSEVLTENLWPSKALWQTEQEEGIDEKASTFVTLDQNVFSVDLGEVKAIKGFSYLPMQARYPSGHITNFSFSISADGKNWKEVSSGEFSNVVNSPVEQLKRFNPVSARYIQLKALKTVDGKAATLAELGILTR